MTIHRHGRNAILACIAALLFAAQVSAGTSSVPAAHPAVVATHHALPRQVSDRRLNAKRLVASLPASAVYNPHRPLEGNCVPLDAPSVLLRHPGIRQARAPPLS